MLKNQKVWVSLGVAIGLVISGLTGTMSWPILGIVMVAYLVLTAVIPSKYADKNSRVVSVGFWLAVGVVTISALAWVFKLSDEIQGTVLIAWMVISVVLGAIWPLSIAKRSANGT